MTRRVVVTGLGPVTGIGVGAEAFHRGQLAGLSGTGPLRRFDPAEAGLAAGIAGEVEIPRHHRPDRRLEATTDRVAQFAVVAADLALEAAGLDPATVPTGRAGVAVGTGIGGTGTWSEGMRTLAESGPGRIGPRMIPKAMGNAAAATVSIRHGLTGPVLAPVLACASGADAIVASAQAIALGEADVMLAGGADAPLVPAIVAGFSVMRALSARTGDPGRASRPFSADRDGFVLAEGAALLVLESEEHALARGAVILAEVAGYGRTADAVHVTMPHPQGDGARRAMEAALRSAHLTPDDVSYVNAHGTGTPLNDAAEVSALRAVFGDSAARIPVSSTKSQLGHSLGASGAIEAVAAVQAIEAGVVPPTINLEEPDSAFGLDFVADGARETKVDAVLSNSFAFGGHNVVLAFTRYA